MAHNYFLELPLELRFKIYHELALSCLNGNRGSDLSGLFRACRQTHQDIKDEYASSVLPILNIMKHWTTLCPEKESLKLDFGYHDSLLRSISISSITVPAHVLKSPSVNFPAHENHRGRIDCLRRISRLSKQTLNLHITPGRWHMCPGAMELFITLSDIHDGQDAFGNATRLILHGDSFLRDARILSDDLLREMQMTHRFRPGATSPYRKVYHVWVARVQQAGSTWGTWLLGFDFEEGLPGVKDVVYRDGVRMA